MSYGMSKRFSKEPEKFGTGHVEGIVESGAANNSALGGAWIPALVFGIPGDSITAIAIGVLYLKNMNPGPTLFVDNPQNIYAVFIVFILAQLLMLPFGWMAIKVAKQILRIPAAVLMPLILLFCIVGSFAINNSMFGVIVMGVAGVVAFFMERWGFPVAPTILGVVLGTMLEEHFFSSLIKADGNFLASSSGRSPARWAWLTLMIWLWPVVGACCKPAKRMNERSDFGLIGLAVMGQNLVLNVESRGFAVSVFNRTASVTHDFVAQHPGKAHRGCDTLPDFVASLKRPRKVQLMVQAGAAVDAVIEQLLPLLDPGDIVIDGGNSLYTDTERRDAWLTAKGLRFVGAGISGGEEGARKGPSIMPGGPASTWAEIRPIYEAIAARVDGEPCVIHIGPGGAGHFVKMVHNGIEYGDMQLICEAYALFQAAGLTAPEIAAVFDQWNQGELQSYLIEITAVRWSRSTPTPAARWST
jgi:6-phosphogluconate dehydrogenase (decarboxylating)